MIGWLLAAPAVLLMVLGFVWPMLGLARISLNRTTETGAMEVALTGETYEKLLGDEFTYELVLNTLGLAGLCAALAVALALPVTLMIRATGPRWRSLVTMLAIAPLLVSATARLVGWMAILGDQGMINGLIRLLLPDAEPVRLLNNLMGVRIGLTESLMPYAVLVLLAGLGRLDARLEEAAATLGAGRIRTFWRVTLPLAAPALLAAWLLCLVLGIASFITPRLMGGGRVFVLATEIFDLALESVDWPAASAMAMLLLGGLVALMLLRGLVGWALKRRGAA